MYPSNRAITVHLYTGINHVCLGHVIRVGLHVLQNWTKVQYIKMHKKDGVDEFIWHNNTIITITIRQTEADNHDYNKLYKIPTALR